MYLSYYYRVVPLWHWAGDRMALRVATAIYGTLGANLALRVSAGVDGIDFD